ncbi:alpha/beta hydrolase [Rhodococcus artemisiae]|uniref:Alpha/beta hydrolase-fold protein n=1 Tax=Rhodococcus artemisiae TaxID=714159 RepID=A0ABU7LBZ6_9NOCA|nr:alpha/beta hydrolase-fold protein [Rhodococcus artemisiae]MEE2058792.1 alpha/beta hydrolase-fold protein [Rhodococcus artemisiae]
MSWSGIADPVLDLPLTTSAAAITFTVAAVAGLGVLAIRRSRRWLLLLPVLGLCALAVTVIAAVVVEKLWRPFPDRLPTTVYVWAGLALLALALLAGRWFCRDRKDRHVLAGCGLIAAWLVVTVAAAAQINAVYDEYPTVRAALGVSDYRTVPFDELARVETVPSDTWSPPPDMPSTGAVTTTPIPGATSEFEARAANIYLPPAYFADPRPELPVLVLLAGQPGSTEDWLVGGRLTQTMDAFAAEHSGLTPIVVLADGTGSEFANPMCVDSRLGNVATYLSVDVPEWVRSNLQVDADPRAWAIGGLSYGGTCALQLATLRPDVYPTFLDISGQAEPTLGDRDQTIDELFGGDEAAYARIDPADLLAHERFPDSAGAFVVGLDDTEYRSGVEQLAAAAKAAGMDVHLTEVPGGHSFEVWSAGLEKELPWLSQRLGLVGP